MRERRFGDFLTDLALLIIVASAILKITYQRTIQAEVKAAVATTAFASARKRPAAMIFVTIESTISSTVKGGRWSPRMKPGS